MSQLIRFKKIHPNATLPNVATPFSAAYDISSPTDCVVPPKSSYSLPLGIAAQIPEGYVGLLFSRSGHGFKHDVSLANSVGVIDSDFRGEIQVRIKNDGLFNFIIKKGVPIAQMLFIKHESWEAVWEDELTETERGENGFGSTGM